MHCNPQKATRRRAGRYGLFMAEFVLHMRTNCYIPASDMTLALDSVIKECTKFERIVRLWSGSLKNVHTCFQSFFTNLLLHERLQQ